MTTELATESYDSYGGTITATKIEDETTVVATYTAMQQGDTVPLAFKGVINQVCKVKGCWMKVAVGGEEEIMVRFKEYGFFVPTDVATDSVVVQGKAYVSETSVADLRHLASDEGQSQEVIAAIVAPEKTYAFIADGVLIQK